MPSLFKLEELRGPIRLTAESARVDGSEYAAEARRGHRLSRCRDVIGAPPPGCNLHVVSAGEWSAHDVIAHLADYSYPADLWVATWSISEDGFRTLLNLRAAGRVNEIYVVADRFLDLKDSARARQLARAQAAKFGTTNTHAKVYVLDGPRPFVVTSSANLSNNKRIEQYTITESAEVMAFHREWIRDALDGAAIFDPDGETAAESDAPAPDSDEIRRWLLAQPAQALLIFRGIPGAGKSELARWLMQQANGRDVSMWDWFARNHEGNADAHRPGEAVRFTQAADDHEKARGWALSNVLEWLRLGAGPIVVHDTFNELHQLDPYLAAARLAGWPVQILELTPRDTAEARRCVKRSIHGTDWKHARRWYNHWRRHPEARITTPGGL